MTVRRGVSRGRCNFSQKEPKRSQRRHPRSGPVLGVINSIDLIRGTDDKTIKLELICEGPESKKPSTPKKRKKTNLRKKKIKKENIAIDPTDVVEDDDDTDIVSPQNDSENDETYDPGFLTISEPAAKSTKSNSKQLLASKPGPKSKKKVKRKLKREKRASYSSMLTETEKKALRLEKRREQQQCPECGKYLSRHNMTAHIRRHNPEARSYHCDVCDASFFYRKDLRVHLSIHTGEKPHECPVCFKCFRQKAVLTEHLLVHNGDKRHLCTYCGKPFARRSDLVVHTRLHTGEKPYSCTECGKKFAQASNYQQHVRTHAGIKRKSEVLLCDTCGLSFPKRATLTEHIKLQHFDLAEVGNMVSPLTLGASAHDHDEHNRELVRSHQSTLERLTPLEDRELVNRLYASATNDRGERATSGLYLERSDGRATIAQQPTSGRDIGAPARPLAPDPRDPRSMSTNFSELFLSASRMYHHVPY